MHSRSGQIWPGRPRRNMPKAHFPPGLPQGHPDFGGPAPKRRSQKGVKKSSEMAPEMSLSGRPKSVKTLCFPGVSAPCGSPKGVPEMEPKWRKKWTRNGPPYLRAFDLFKGGLRNLMHFLKAFELI